MKLAVNEWGRAVCTIGLLLGVCALTAEIVDGDLRVRVSAAMREAAAFYRTEVAVHGGYVYYYSTDLKQRLGEGVAWSPSGRGSSSHPESRATSRKRFWML